MRHLGATLRHPSGMFLLGKYNSSLITRKHEIDPHSEAFPSLPGHTFQKHQSDENLEKAEGLSQTEDLEDKQLNAPWDPLLVPQTEKGCYMKNQPVV